MDDRQANNAELTPQQLDHLFELFLACREMDKEARSAWLRQACQGNLSLERRAPGQRGRQCRWIPE